MMHPTWELNVNQASLILTPCPGTKGVDLYQSLVQLKSQSADAIVTALSQKELSEKGLDDFGEQVQALGMQWYSLPIEDDCAPDANFSKQWEEVSPKLHQVVNDEGKVVMHCMGGSGRTGLLAANLLLELGWDLDTIYSQVKSLRPGAFTKQPQIDYVEALAKQFK